MKIDRIKNYNQKMLAVLGSIVVLIAIVALIATISFAIDEINRSLRRNNQDEGILSDERIEELQKENKRKQLISYDIPSLVDTLNLIYIIPVSHKTLNSEEYIDDQVLGLMDMHGSYKTDSRFSSMYYGDFNNLLIYDYKNHKIDKLFENRINFEDIRTEYFQDDILVLFKASTKDSYKDGVINQQDYKTLFIYSLKSKDLKEISLENMDISDIQFIENSKDLIINFGIDHNQDGKYDKYREPSILKKFDFDKGELVDIISEKLNTELQKKLEGTNK